MILALTLLSGQATASPQVDVVPDVQVLGVAGDPVRRFVSGITVPGEHGRFEGQVARRGADLCVNVVGAAPEVNSYLTDQIAANFRSLAIPHAAPGCEATVAVVVSMDADAFAETYAARARARIFQGRPGAVARFTGPPRPVRWHHVARTGLVGPDPLHDPVADSLDARLGRMPGSRLRVSTARAIEQTIIVVDAHKAATAPLDALAAYLAFVAVVDLPPEPSTAGRRTILSLFDETNADRATALTRWDRAFVKALYGMTADRSFGFQQAEIEARMRRELETPGR